VAIRTIIRDVAPDTVVSLTPLTDRLSASLALPRLAAALFSAIAVLAVALTALGVLAALSYGLTQRAREFGVRVAVGATRRQLVTLVVRHGVLPAAVGVLLGLAASAAVTRGMQTVLFGVSPLDTKSFVVAPVVIIPITTLACLLPAIRASRVDPATVLKAE
jgi:ABC-type antimicrobial peptide transport system permease subunit